MKESRSKYQQKHGTPWFAAFFIFLLVLVGAGWLVRGENHFVPDSGMGYFAGVLGTALMFVLLLYPARKKIRFFEGWGTTQSWFEIHMALGVAGPVLILFHCNFNMGSLNAAVALVSTLLLAVSGLTGRYVYQKIYLGFSGRLANLKLLQQEVDDKRSGLLPVLRHTEGLEERLRSFENLVKMPYEMTLAGAFFTVFSLRCKAWVFFFKERAQIKRSLNNLARTRNWSTRKKNRTFKKALALLDTHVQAILRVSMLSFFERLFSIWHLLHLPLFFFFSIDCTCARSCCSDILSFSIP
ncbi:MAG: hypothetical protein ACE5FU_05100 [Nitrospinota bacterium]